MTPQKIAAELVDLNHHDAPGSGRQLMLWAVYLAETPVVTVWAMLSGNATGLSENQPRQYPLAGVGQDYPGDGGQSYPAPPAQAYPITADQSYPLAGVVQSYPGQAA